MYTQCMQLKYAVNHSILLYVTTNVSAVPASAFSGNVAAYMFPDWNTGQLSFTSQQSMCTTIDPYNQE